MLRIGLTGGMGAGKSTVARILAELGAVVVDSDVIAREVVAPGTAGLAALVETFGDEIVCQDGTLDRAALVAKAFADEQSRAKLNAIVHPLVGGRTVELIDTAPRDAIVVQDIPLLVENGLAPLMNLVLVVEVPEEIRVKRLVEHRGIDESDARARISAQATDDQRRAVADVLLDNTTTPEALAEVVKQVWHRRLVPFERNVREAIPVDPTASPTLDYGSRTDASRGERLIARLRLLCGANAVAVRQVHPVTGNDQQDADAGLVIQIETNQPFAVLATALRDGGFPPLASAEAEFGNADPGSPARVQLTSS